MNTPIKTEDDLKAVLKQYTGSDKISYDLSYWVRTTSTRNTGRLEYLAYSRGKNTLVFRNEGNVDVILIDVWPKYKRTLWKDGLTFIDMQQILPLLQHGGTMHGHWGHGISIRLARPIPEAQILDLFRIGFFSYWEDRGSIGLPILVMKG